MTWHQKGSESRQIDRGGVFGLSHSPGYLVRLTFKIQRGTELPNPFYLVSLSFFFCLVSCRLVPEDLANGMTNRRVCLYVCPMSGFGMAIFLELIMKVFNQKSYKVMRRRAMSLQLTHCRFFLIPFALRIPSVSSVPQLKCFCATKEQFFSNRE